MGTALAFGVFLSASSAAAVAAAEAGAAGAEVQRVGSWHWFKLDLAPQDASSHQQDDVTFLLGNIYKDL